jgi:hypothetical protein
MDKDKLYLALYEFKNLAMDTQGQVTNKLYDLLDRVADGAWQQNDHGFFTSSQCAFCYRSPENGHDDDCPVTLARELKEELS